MKKAMADGLKRVAKSRLIAAGLAVALISMAGAATPAIAQDAFSQDITTVKACASDIWRLCSDVLPDVDRVKSCVQSKMGQLSKGCLADLLDKMSGSSFKICKNQTYALCAAARCNVYDGVAYCQCEVKHGDSISLPFAGNKSGDVCVVNAAVAENKYMVSTYSLPDRIIAGKGDSAVYTCPGGDSAGAYAQCDGGMCFESTGGTTFPGFDRPIPKGQIVCSCPATKGSAGSAPSYQIMGPYPCDNSFFNYCSSSVATTKTGSTIYVGAPAGAVQGLAAALNGKVPPVNECHLPGQ